jgi:hypothetical protein
MLEAAFSDPIARVGRKRLVGTVGQHDTIDTKERRAADNCTQIMRIADAVEKQERLSAQSPFTQRLRDKIEDWLRPGDRNDAAVQDGTGDAREFGVVCLTIGFAVASEVLAERADLAAQIALEEQAFDPPGILLEQCADRGEAADPQQLSFMQASGVHCDGA